VKPDKLNAGPDHLSRLEFGKEGVNLDDNLPDAQLFSVRMVDDHFWDVIQFLNTRVAPDEYTTTQKKKLVICATDFQLIVGKLYKLGLDEILRRYVLEHERHTILAEAHGGLARGYYVGKETAKKIPRIELWWPTQHKDVK